MLAKQQESAIDDLLENGFSSDAFENMVGNGPPQIEFAEDLTGCSLAPEDNPTIATMG